MLAEDASPAEPGEPCDVGSDFIRVGDGDGDGLIGGVTGGIGGANGDDVGVVSSGIAYVGWIFVIGSGIKDQSAGCGINGEFAGIISSIE